MKFRIEFTRENARPERMTDVQLLEGPEFTFDTRQQADQAVAKMNAADNRSWRGTFRVVTEQG